jgi:hypothetical protein
MSGPDGTPTAHAGLDVYIETIARDVTIGIEATNLLRL